MRSPPSICLETPGLDTLDILVLWKGFADDRLDADDLRQRGTVEGVLPRAERVRRVAGPTDGLYEVTVPGQHQIGLALPWGGTSHPVWFKRDPRVANVRAVGGLFDRALMQGVPQIVGAVLKQIKDLPRRREVHRALRAGLRL